VAWGAPDTESSGGRHGSTLLLRSVSSGVQSRTVPLWLQLAADAITKIMIRPQKRA
jgi:hypothetical protein